MTVAAVAKREAAAEKRAARTARRLGVSPMRSNRPGLIRGAKGRRGAVTITFRLARRAVIVFKVTQVAPDCRSVGTFRVRGRPGVNRVRFAGRIAKRVLPPGTYKLRPRVAGARRGDLPSVVVVILPKGSDMHDAKRLRSRNVCYAEQAAAAADEQAEGFASSFGFVGAMGGFDGLAVAGPVLGNSGATGSSSGSGSSAGSGSAASIAEIVPRIGRALGVTSPEQIVESFDSPWVFAGLALAILLLALAAAPRTVVPHQRLTTLVADRRLELALVGAGALVVVTVAYLLTVM